MSIKHFILSGMMLLVALSFGACGEEGPAVDSSWNDGSLSVKDEVPITTVQTINIKATSKPKLSCDAEWLKIGEVTYITVGIYSAELTAEPNVTGETRRAQVIVSAGKESSVVTVVQESGDVVEIRSVDPQGDLDPAGGILTVRYVSNGIPAVNLPEWITLTGSRSLEEGVLNLSYAANTTGKERTALIVLAVGKDAVANVTVRQPSR